MKSQKKMEKSDIELRWITILFAEVMKINKKIWGSYLEFGICKDVCSGVKYLNNTFIKKNYEAVHFETVEQLLKIKYDKFNSGDELLFKLS